MYILRNNQLQVEILDPIADQNRMGTRYCTGGYIFQIHDAKHGPLLTGPTYPYDFNWYDGQGIPDAFNLMPLRDPNSSDRASLVLGIGLCDLAERKVLEYCAWDVEQSETSIMMRTRHVFQGYDVSLERTVSLLNRTVRSQTTVHNNSNTMVPINWFPHPFYPQPEEPELFRVNIPISMPENAGYELAENGFVTRKVWAEGHSGHYQALDHQAQNPVVVQQRHPALGLVSASCDYMPSFFPIWGNHYTFSWEPFLERTLAPTQHFTWKIDYDF